MTEEHGRDDGSGDGGDDVEKRWTAVSHRRVGCRWAHKAERRRCGRASVQIGRPGAGK